MNIFDKFLDELKPLILKNKIELGIETINDFKGVTAENPPADFDYDMSLNICLILSKINKKNPRELAEKIKKL